MSEHQVKKVSEGKPEDVEPDLQFNFGIKDGLVVVDFGKKVTWVALPPDDADQFAQIMMRVAEQARRGQKVATPPQ